MVAVGPGALAKDGKLMAMNVSVGDRVLLPEYGGHSVKIGDEECVAAAWAPAPTLPRATPFDPLLTMHLPPFTHPTTPPQALPVP